MASLNSCAYAYNTHLLAALESSRMNFSEAINLYFECHEIYCDFVENNYHLILANPSDYDQLWNSFSVIKSILSHIYRLNIEIASEKDLIKRIQEFENTKQNNSLILAYELLSAHYCRQHKYAQALNCYEAVKKNSKQFDFTTLAVLYEKNSKWDEALQCYEKALESNAENKAFIHLGIGICNRELHKYDKATEAYLQAREFYKEKKDISGIANTYNLLSYMHCYTNQLDLAIEEAQEALKILETAVLPSPLDFYAFYDTLGFAYELNSEVDLAEEYLNKSIAVGKKMKQNDRTFALKFISLGNIHFKKQNIKKARQQWKQALEYLDKNQTDLIDKIEFNLKNEPKEIPRS